MSSQQRLVEAREQRRVAMVEGHVAPRQPHVGMLDKLAGDELKAIVVRVEPIHYVAVVIVLSDHRAAAEPPDQPQEDLPRERVALKDDNPARKDAKQLGAAERHVCHPNRGVAVAAGAGRGGQPLGAARPGAGGAAIEGRCATHRGRWLLLERPARRQRAPVPLAEPRHEARVAARVRLVGEERADVAQAAGDAVRRHKRVLRAAAPPDLRST
eukprot:3689507-Prymnesium_polylepis.1